MTDAYIVDTQFVDSSESRMIPVLSSDAMSQMFPLSNSLQR